MHLLSTNPLVRFWSSPLLPPVRLLSSANCRLHMGLPPMEMDVWWSWSVSCWSSLGTGWTLSRMGESRYPWRAPVVVLKNSPSWLCNWTALLELLYSAWMAWTSPSSLSKLLRTCHRPARQTLMNTQKPIVQQLERTYRSKPKTGSTHRLWKAHKLLASLTLKSLSPNNSSELSSASLPKQTRTDISKQMCCIIGSHAMLHLMDAFLHTTHALPTGIKRGHKKPDFTMGKPALTDLAWTCESWCVNSWAWPSLHLPSTSCWPLH